jgi:D-amino-acid dehydrogenase
MRVLVLGAGVIGVTSAYRLAVAGHEVVVVDRQDGAARETSFANSGQIAAYNAQPWAAPGVPRMVIEEFGRADAPFLFRLRFDPAMWRWATRFLRLCTPEAFQRTLADMNRLSSYSLEALTALREAEAIEYDRRAEGTLNLYRTPASFEKAAAMAGREEDARFRPQALDMDACVGVEPALQQSRHLFAGALHMVGDETGDAHEFAVQLAEHAAMRGVDFRYDTRVTSLAWAGDRVQGANTDHGAITADATVVSLGSYSPLILRPLGIRVPIYPVKGYSVTVPTAGHNGAPTHGIYDRGRKLSMSRLGARLRSGGTAEFAGYSTHLDARRAQAILDMTMAVFPSAGDATQAELWTGLRPMTPDCAPVLGRTPYRGLYLNTGHGSLGWTLSCGSARIIADIVSGRPPEIDLTGLTLDRF